MINCTRAPQVFSYNIIIRLVSYYHQLSLLNLS